MTNRLDSVLGSNFRRSAGGRFGRSALEKFGEAPLLSAIVVRFARETLSDPTLLAAWRRMIRLWRPMAAWTLLVWATVAIVFVPLSSAFVAWQLERTNQLVIGNEELLAWFLTPIGIAYLLVAATLALAHAVLRYAGLFQIIVDDLEHPPPSFRIIALELAARVPTLLRFCVKSVALSLLLLAPIMGGVFAIYRVFLGDHDINFYLEAKPRAWYQALSLTAAWAAIATCAVAYGFGRSLLALPVWLDGHRGMTRALRQSWALTRTRAGRLLRLIGLTVGIWVLLRVLVTAAIVAIASALTAWIAGTFGTLGPLLIVFSAFVGGTVAVNVVIGFLGFSFLSTVLTKFYLEDTALHQTAPVPGPGETLPATALATLRPWLNPRRLVPLLIVLLAVAFGFSRRTLDRLPEPARVAITAHRGGPPPAPENTLAALERAIAAGADYSEIDVMRTRDGVVVVAHDADLMRLARDPRRIADTRFADFSKVVKQPDDGSPEPERRLATLGEFLERARGRIKLNIELKYYRWDPHLARAVADEVRTRGMEQEVAIMSLNHEAVRQTRALAPEISAGYVSSLAVGAITRLKVDFVAVNRTRITPALMRDAQQRGIQIHAWTVNQPGAMADLIEMGVDGLITDNPALAVRVREQLSRMSPPERLLLRFRKLLLPNLLPTEEEIADEPPPEGKS